MEPIIKAGPDQLTLIAEPGALTFATRKEWIELPETVLDELRNHSIIHVFKGRNNSIYLLLHNIRPLDYFSECGNNNLLVKIALDGTGNQRVFYMSLSPAESAQLRRNRLALWD